MCVEALHSLPAGRLERRKMLEILHDEFGDEKAHAAGVRGCRGCVKASFCITTNHLLLVSVAARVWQWALVVAGRVENWPTRITEALHALEVRKEARRFLAITLGKLALMPGNSPKPGITMGRANVVELPDAGWLSRRHPAEVFRVL